MPIVLLRQTADGYEAVYFHDDGMLRDTRPVPIPLQPFDPPDQETSFERRIRDYRDGTISADHFQELGQWLGNWILRNGLEIWVQGIPNLESSRRLAFRFEDRVRTKVEALPLEAILNHQGQRVAQADLYLLRYVKESDIKTRATDPPSASPLRVLLVRAAPYGEDPVPEVAPLVQRLRGMKGEDQLILDVLTSETAQGLNAVGFPTWESIVDQLVESRYHVLVFVGHGVLNNMSAEGEPGGQLVFEMEEDRNGRRYPDTRTGKRVSDLLHLTPIPAVVLVGCLTAAELRDTERANVPKYLRGSLGTAQLLVESPSGVKCAVGMQQKIQPQDATTFLESFFKSLLDSSPGNFEVAVREARLELLRGNSPSSWSAPVTFSTLPPEPMFSFVGGGSAVEPLDAADAVAIRAAIAGMALRDVLATLAVLGVPIGLGAEKVFTDQQFSELLRWSAEENGRSNVVLTALRQRARLAPIRRYLEGVEPLIRVLLPHGFIAPTAIDLDAAADNKPVNAVERINKLIQREEPAFVLVLGDYGVGKSSLCFGMCREFARQALEDFPNRPIPMYLHLGYARSKSADHLLDAIPELLKDYKITTTADDLKTIVTEHRTVMFLDGLDEMLNRVAVEDLHAAMEKIHDLIALSSRMDVILTCRETFFQSPDETRRIKGVTERLRLKTFDDDQVREYLEGWQPRGDTVERVAEARKATIPSARAAVKSQLQAAALAARTNDAKLQEITQTPVHLFLLGQYLERAIRDGTQTVEIDLLGLYESFVDEALDRDMMAVADDKDANRDWPFHDRKRLIGELAYQWHKDDVTDWTIREFEEFVAAHLRSFEQDYSAEKKAILIRERAKFITTCSFMQRIARASRFRFSHKSFREYLVATLLVEDALQGDLTRWNTAMYTELFDFGEKLIHRAGLKQEVLDSVRTHEKFLARGNFIVTAFRPGLLDEQLLRDMAFTDPHPAVRQVAVQSLCPYPPLEKNVDCVLDVIAKEKNSVVRETARKLLTRYAREEAGRLDEARRARVQAELVASSVVPADAVAILDSVAPGHPGIRNTYRRALNQKDDRWYSVLGAVYLLGSTGDEKIRHDIHRVVSAMRNPEVRQAYEEVRALDVWKPPLPELLPLPP